MGTCCYKDLCHKMWDIAQIAPLKAFGNVRPIEKPPLFAV